jgi:hypothetical protein
MPQALLNAAEGRPGLGDDDRLPVVSHTPNRDAMRPSARPPLTFFVWLATDAASFDSEKN